MNRLITTAMFAATPLVLTGCRTYGTEQAFELTAPWKDYERLVVRSPRGSVTLRKTDVPDIRISGTKHASGLTLEEAQENLKHVRIVAQPDAGKASVFVVEVRHPWWLSGGSVGGSFEIQVPISCAADIQTDDGSVAVSGLITETVLKTSNGEITIDDVAGDVRAHSSRGRIVAENVTGDLLAVTSNGEIRAKTIRGDCDLTTSNGAVHMEDVCGSVKASLSNGDIRLDGTPPEGGHAVLRTRNGSIYLTLPADLKAELDLQTGNGVVQTTLEDMPLRVRRWSQNRVQAGINGGGGTSVIATTTRGVITLECR
ncbi:MAG: DUF4097 family beta strand repeat protein [Phycisphaerales bacterium]|nr:MAG: DUF4097 family beta strand repeat protein [Phycisphaerales bacterium]